MPRQSPMTLDGLRKRQQRAGTVPKGELVTKTSRRSVNPCARCGKRCNLQNGGIRPDGWTAWRLKCMECGFFQSAEMIVRALNNE